MSAIPEALRSRAATAAALAVLTGLVFARAVGAPFIRLDDPEYVTENPQVLQGLTTGSLEWAFTTGHAANWHPITWISHMLDVTAFGRAPAGHHATNLVLHGLNAALLFALLSVLTGSRWRSALAAALFALHPLRVESVAWVAERKDVLSGTFWLATCLAYVAWVRAPSRRRYALVVACYALGLMSKPTLVTLPFALLLLDAWPLRRVDLGQPSRAAVWPLVREKAPLFAMSIASCVATVAAQRSWGAMQPLEHVGLLERISHALVSVVSYVAKVVWPSGLAIFYPYPASPPSAAAIAIAVVALAGATALAWRFRRTHPQVLVGWLWFVGVLVPMLGLVQVGAQAMADRYTYVPTVGLAILAAWSVPEARSPRWRAATTGAALAAVALLAGATVRQLGFWRSERALFEHAAAVTDRNWVAETGLGLLVEREGDAQGAIARYRRALAYYPGAPQALTNLGNLLVTLRETAEGIGYLREAARLWPGKAPALANLGAALCETGQLREGLPLLQQAARLAPTFVSARYDLGVALLDAGRPDEALAEFLAVVRLAPDDVQAWAHVQRLSAALGRPVPPRAP